MLKEKAADTFKVIIEKLVYGGSGFARYQGKVVFIPFSVPGDELLVRPVEVKKTYIRAAISRILKPGKGRIQPACPHFEKCGGCDWQQLEYSSQVEAKRRILEELFHHKFPATKDIPIIMHACPQPFGYRSRARMQVRGCGPKATVGFFRSGSHVVEDVEGCPLFRPSLNEALSSLRQSRFKADSEPALQEMDLACSEEEGTWATECLGIDPNRGVSPLIGPGRKEVLLRRKIGEFIYSITASVFFQANDFMVEKLVERAMACAKDSGNESALDLFSGVGFFSLPLARRFRQVLAVEYSKPSCRLCTANAAASGMKQIQTICADASAWMGSDASASLPPFDLIMLDPPRTGAGPGIMERICERSPKIIIYVSCDPQTLVRDLARISQNTYKIDFIEGLDLFPQTYHFETVVRLVKK